MDKAKYNRAAKDPSQLQQFVDEVCDNAGGSVTDLYLELEEEPTQEQLEQVYKQKPDVLRLGMDGGQHVVVLHKSLQSESETRLNYFNIQNAAGDIQLLKIEYSEEDGYYIADPYEWSLDNIVSGTSDGTNWTSLTIGDETHGIPQGGGSQLYKHTCRGDIAFSNKTFIFISTNGESYVGSYSDSKLRSDLADGKIISACMINDSGTPVASSVVLVDTGTVVAGLLSPASINPTGTSLTSQNIITPTPGITTDVVTEL